MSFGNNTPAPVIRNPDLPANTPTRADASVITAGLYGIRPNRSPARSNTFNSGGASPTLGRKPDTAKRSLIGGT
jgi:hypothetical protein